MARAQRRPDPTGASLGLRAPRGSLIALAGTDDGGQQPGLVELLAEEHSPEDDEAGLRQQDAAGEGGRRQGDDQAADTVNDVERSRVAKATHEPARAVRG